MQVRGVLFDLDDTLFDHNFATIQALERLCVEEPAFTCWPVEELRRRYSVLLEELHATRFRRRFDRTRTTRSGDRRLSAPASRLTAVAGSARIELRES